jgi:uncharacterized protein (TIGR02996 family)
MTDHDALLAAICAEPDEDTPRLAYADFLEENDRPEQAAFVRAQIELARTPAWSRSRCCAVGGDASGSPACRSDGRSRP